MGALLGRKMRALMRTCLLLLAILLAAAAVPLENPLTEADDMLAHVEMENGPQDLGESMGTDDDKDEDVFDMPSTEDALDEDEAIRKKDANLMKDGALSDEERVEAKLQKAVKRENDDGSEDY